MSLLGLSEKSQVHLTVQADPLVVTPVRPVGDKDAFEAAAYLFHTCQAEAFHDDEKQVTGFVEEHIAAKG